MIKPNIGVPQRIPQQFGDLGHHTLRHIVVQQHQIKIGVGRQLAASQPAGRDDGEPTGCRDADFGRLGGQPQLMQILQSLAQRGGVETTRTTVEELPARRGEIGGGV